MMTMMVDVAINPDKFDKLIASLRTAVDVGGIPYI